LDLALSAAPAAGATALSEDPDASPFDVPAFLRRQN
jgi:hypothetical protein